MLKAGDRVRALPGAINAPSPEAAGTVTGRDLNSSATVRVRFDGATDPRIMWEEQLAVDPSPGGANAPAQV